MPYKQIASPEAKYLAATDILIGDMSDINYEFLLFNRPVVLLANGWLRDNFPDIGIKTDLKGLSTAIKRSVEYPDEYESLRMHWLKRTINEPYENASKKILDIAIEKSGYDDPVVVLLHGNSSVRKTNLECIYEEGLSNNINIEFTAKPKGNFSAENIYIAAHFDDLNIEDGFKVHLDHGLKGKGTANVEMSATDYEKNNYFPYIDIHITAGREGFLRTRNLLLGPNRNRAVIGGYPKCDALLKANNQDNRMDVCNELGFNPDKEIVTYAPSGPLSYKKPGGSLSYGVLMELRRISKNNNYNVLVKLKNKKHKPQFLPLKRLKSFLYEKINRW